MEYALLSLIDLVANVLIFGLFIYIILQYFLDPFHPVREFLYQIFEPLLRPIRQFVPIIGNFDFSPIVLYILVRLGRLFLFQIVSMIFT